MDFQKIPKVELHLHLDCSLSYSVVSRIDPSVTKEQYENDFIAPPKCKDLADYLIRAIQGFQRMQTKEVLEWVTLDLFDQLKKDNVIYVEIRFAPLLHTQQGLSGEEVVSIVNDTMAKACRQTGIEARLILCTLRRFNEDQGLKTVRLIEQFRDTLVAGFDIAGDEVNYPVNDHVAAFRLAYEKGIPATSHGGEARGPESMWEILENFKPVRFGHGVRSVEDKKLVDFLIKNNFHLEVCPTSNIQTNVFDTMNNHSIDYLYHAGVSVGINTDARTVSNVTLVDEYRKLNQYFGWGMEHFLQCNLNALDAAFLPEEKKAELKSVLIPEYMVK